MSADASLPPTARQAPERRPGRLEDDPPTSARLADDGEDPDRADGVGTDLVDQLVEACAQRGILVMLDIHRVRAKGDISPLWYEGAYKANTNAQIKAGFQKLIDRYADDWNVFALVGLMEGDRLGWVGGGDW